MPIRRAAAQAAQSLNGREFPIGIRGRFAFSGFAFGDGFTFGDCHLFRNRGPAANRRHPYRKRLTVTDAMAPR